MFDPKYFKKFLLVCIAGNNFGYGHLIRSKSLADHIIKLGLDVKFLVFSDQNEIDFINNYEVIYKKIKDLKNIPNLQEIKNSKFDSIIIDISHDIIFENKSNTKIWLNFLDSNCKRFVIIDSVGSQSIYKNFKSISFDFAVFPYILEKADISETPKLLIGEKYSILSTDYTDIRKNFTLNHKSPKIIVTCGGSDFKGLTKDILKKLENYTLNLDITVIIGPLFSKKLKEFIYDFTNISSNNITPIDSPHSICEYINNCDIAMGTSGLTKYEFAVLGKPSILISIDKFHSEANKAFVSKGFSFEIDNPIKQSQLFQKIKYIYENYNEISSKALLHIDGKGGQRIINKILDL